MDAITKGALLEMSNKYPRKAVRFPHQFLDGEDGKGCGFVPGDWDGTAVEVDGKWWDIASKKSSFTLPHRR